MKSLLLILFSFFTLCGTGQVVLNADGPGDTYELITSVLAPGANPIETPDCSHEAFGNHIDELFDEELGINVFRFYMHTTPDDDRCMNFDRQRNEIKSYGSSPDNLLGVEGEKVIYKWKFKLDEGFQSSPNFTHIHQLKSVGGDLAGMPMYTLTTRKGSEDQLELRYAETSSQITLKKTNLAPFLGEWVEVTETILYGFAGNYEIVIERVADKETLFAYKSDEIINWRVGGDFVRPKWGIYRSIDNIQDLRDEAVLFSSFSIEEVGANSSIENESTTELFKIYPNPSSGDIYIESISEGISEVWIMKMDGQLIFNRKFESEQNVRVDISSFVAGTYTVTVWSKSGKESKVVLFSNEK